MNNKDIIISIATLDQVPQLNQLIQYSAKELSRGFYSKIETNAAIDYVFGVDTTLIKDQTYFTASIRGELVGCGGWSHRTTLYGGDQRPVDQTQQFQEAYNSETAKK